MTDTNERPKNTLIVECPGCGTQFRFDRTLFHASPGARVRCRRCGKPIEVSNPDIPAKRSADDAPRAPERPEARAAEGPARLKSAPPAQTKATPAPQPEANPPPQSEAIPPPQPDATRPPRSEAAPSPRSEAAPSPRPKATSPPQPKATPPPQPKATPPAAPRSAQEPRVPASQVPPERGWKRNSDIFRVEEPAGGAPEARRRQKVSLFPYLAIAVAFVFALVAGFWYFETEGNGIATKTPAVAASRPQTAPAPKAGEFTFERVETTYRRNPQAGLLFVLTGHVTQVPPSAGNGRVRVRVSVLGAENRVIAQKTVVAGVTIPDEVILQQGREGIDRAISDAASAGSPAAATAPAESLPFQAVFFDVAGKVGSYELAAERER